jgi:hypothetical protein
MKRVIALLIVFAMASAASAASVEVRLNGAPMTGNEVQFSDIITIVLVDDGSDGTATQTLNASFINVSAADDYSHTWYAAPFGGWSFTPEGAGYTSGGNGIWIGGQLPANGEIFVHEFHVPDLPFSTEIAVDYNIDYLRLVPEDKAGQMLLHVTPEPMTIGLLGLGALGLLRRRRKA